MGINAETVENEMLSMRDEAQARHLSKFFKTGKGEYGEGDKFLGIKVPETRKVARKYKDTVSLDDIDHLIHSEWHEIRLLGFLLLIELYKKNKGGKNNLSAEQITDFYLKRIDFGNNWDLVDLIAPKILGDRINDEPGKEKILYELSMRKDSLWHQRVAIVATWALIINGNYSPTLKLAEQYLYHSHDLIHKATGWMLREMGKRGGISFLKEFLELHKKNMPRTMLRYAIEKFPKNEREYYMKSSLKKEEI